MLEHERARRCISLEAILPAFMWFCLCVALSLHMAVTMQVGFMSDDYALMHSAKHGAQFWHLHYSPLLEFLWRCTADGRISALAWHMAVLAAHVVNVALFYVLARRGCSLNISYSLLAATLFALSPAGIEALAWTCAAGYVLTMSWILVALLCFLSWRQNEHYRWLKGGALALLQVGAWLTWEWGVLLFPVLCVFSLLGAHTSWRLLAPVATCWLAAVLLRSLSSHGVFWQHNDWATAVLFFFGSPLLGLMPNLDKDAYFSVYALAFYAGLAGLLSWAAWRQRLVLVLLACFFGAILPWVKGGNPSSRYFYLAMPFMYMAIVVALSRLRLRGVAGTLAALLLASQFWSAYERALLWVEADHAAHMLVDQTVALLATAEPETKVVIVNVPEAYGPPQMAMRPQMWYCGFREYLAERQQAVTLAKTDDCAFVWHRSADRLPRQDIALMYPESLIYEVVYHPANPKEFMMENFLAIRLSRHKPWLPMKDL